MVGWNPFSVSLHIKKLNQHTLATDPVGHGFAGFFIILGKSKPKCFVLTFQNASPGSGFQILRKSTCVFTQQVVEHLFLITVESSPANTGFRLSRGLDLSLINFGHQSLDLSLGSLIGCKRTCQYLGFV